MQRYAEQRRHLRQKEIMGNLASTLFTTVGGVASHLPKFRGKDGAFLRLFNALGLKSHHTMVEVVLKAPIPYKVRLDLHSWLQRLAFVSGEYEADTVSFLVKINECLDRPGYMLDIGANIGLIGIPTALLIQESQATPGISVVCVEAVPDNEKALRHNISLNNATDIISVIGTGLGDIPGRVEIQVEGDLKTGEGTGTANILPSGSTLDPNGTYECVRIPIGITTLDELMRTAQLPAECKLVKIDTDGYDLKILQGGRDFLRVNRPTIYGEFMEHCLRWHGQSVVDVVEFAKSIDYIAWQRIPGKTFRFAPTVDVSSYSQDLMLIPIENENVLSWCCQT